jgi:hypothetical protein
VALDKNADPAILTDHGELGGAGDRVRDSCVAMLVVGVAIAPIVRRAARICIY